MEKSASANRLRKVHPLLRNAMIGITAAGIGGVSAAAGGRLADKHRKKKIRESEGNAMTELQKIAQANGISEEELAEYLFEQGLAKIASDLNAELEEEYELTKEAAEDFEEALVKVAYYTGFDPEYLAEAIFEHREELEKIAQIEEIIEGLTDEEVEELLKEAAANNTELAGAIAEAEENQENQELAYLAALIDELSEEEAEELLKELSEKDDEGEGEE